MYVTGDNPPAALELGDLPIAQSAHIDHHGILEESGAWSGRGHLRRIQSRIWHTELSARRLKYYASNTPHSDGHDVNYWLRVFLTT